MQMTTIPISRQSESGNDGLRLRSVTLSMLGVVVLIALLLASTFYLWYFSPSGSWISVKSSEEPIAEEVSKLIERVRSHVALPQDEAPTVAMVKSAEPLRGQVFFQDAQIGDAVIIYSKSKKVILYDPRTDRIINMAPLSDNAPTIGN